MALQVIGAGLGRTGTASLKLGLEELLGGCCYHMFEVGKRPEHTTAWADAYEGKLPDWQALFADFTAAVDWPAAPFWREMSEAFPDAVIVLSIRDVDSWWRSASSTIFRALDTYHADDAPADDWTRMGRNMMAAFTPDWRDETAAKAAYEAHVANVRATAPADRLVEWQASDGWGPLCEALSIAVPSKPFPHVNTTEETRAALGLEN